jgi:hypothetical protein
MKGGEVRPRKRRIVAVVALVVLMLLVALGLLWSRREPIARDYVDRALAAKGVQGSYRITRLGVTSQRLENVVLGDPRAPDLTADVVQIHLSVGLGWPGLRSVSASGVRLRGKLIDGKLSLGALDRLLPAPSGAPFALPNLDVDLRDARMALATPWGAVGMALDGRGNLAGGFTGRLAAVTRRIDVGGCRAEGATAFVNIATTKRQPSVDGPIRARRIACGRGVGIDDAHVALDATGSASLDAWRGNALLRVGSVRQGTYALQGLSGRVGFNQNAAGASGDATLAVAGVRGGPVSRGRLAADGQWRVGADNRFNGNVRFADGAIAPAALRNFLPSADAADGTPAGPLWRALADAIGRAAGGLGGEAQLAVVHGGEGGSVRVSAASFGSASGVAGRFEGGDARFAWPSAKVHVTGNLALSGGGLPTTRLSLSEGPSGRAGQAIVAPFAAGAARLTLAPVRFGPAPGSNTAFSTIATIDGPLADGRVAGLRVPLAGRIGQAGLVIGEGCVPLTFARLELAGLALGASRLPLCPTGKALVFRDPDGALGGGATIVRPRLSGRIGSAPATIAAERLSVALGRPGFTADAVAVRIGAGETVTRLDLAALRGEVAAGGIAGTFTGAGGNIGAVPLILSQGSGGWRVAGAVLTLAGQLRIADRAASARFNPLESGDVRLRLEGGRITATGRLVEPATRSAVSDVTLVHDLSTGVGDAVLDVPGLLFSEGLQPEALTPLTLGVVANVRGVVSGRGNIRWTPNSATSDGRFRTDGLALAAAFGPVTGIKGEIVFSDLLALATPPGQTVTLSEVNPGVAVTGGIVRYQLLPDQLMRIEGGHWPFSGGELLLEPTLLDFGKPSDRRLTFRVVGMDAAKFVQQFEFKNIALTGTFDGVLPMVFGASGGRIVGGNLQVRRGGGTLAYVGEISNAQLGMFAKLAFDALKSMRYDALSIDLDGALDGELISRVLFNGTNETPKVAKGGLLAQFTGLPFRFNITIRAPFRGLLNSAQSLSDPRALIGQALPKAVAPPPAPVQPKESETVP